MRLAVLGDDRVQGVGALPIGEVRPGGEYAQRTQLPAMLVRHHVVGIVGTGAGILEAAEDLAGQQAAGDDPICPIGIARDLLEDDVHVVAGERCPLAVRALHGRLRVDGGVLRIERRQERLDLVVAERPEDFRCDADGAGGGPGRPRRIELEEPGLTPRIGRGEAGMRACRLLADQHPFRRVWRRTDVRAARDFFRRDRPGADAIGEPARVGDFVDGVDVLCAQAARLVLRVDEQVVHQFVHLRLVVGRRFRGVPRFGLARDRIVGIETRRLGRSAGGEEADGASRGRDEGGTAEHGSRASS